MTEKIQDNSVIMSEKVE